VHGLEGVEACTPRNGLSVDVGGADQWRAPVICMP
jgi:hypothetical protein